MAKMPKEESSTATRRPGGRDKHEAIVAAALVEFAERGFAGARLEDVAARAGVGKGTIYLYFPSKEALFQGMVRARLLPGLAQAQRLIEDADASAKALLRALLTTLYREVIATDARQVMRLIIAEGPRFPALTSFYFEEVIGRGRALLRGIVARGQATGEFGHGPATETPEVVMGPLLLAAMWKVVFDGEEPLDLERFLDAHTDLVLRGLRR